jgi:hypothetical protein
MLQVPASEERLIWSLSRFLAAAAKKYTPARIVVVIDGIFALKGEGMPAGALHWLPTELPPGVRFIVSTIARDLTAAAAAAPATAAAESSGSVSNSSSCGGGSTTAAAAAAAKPAKRRDHRTYMELRRRACPMLEMEPLSDTCQRAIIQAFAALPALPGDAPAALNATAQQQQQSASADVDTDTAAGTTDAAATGKSSGSTGSAAAGGGPHLSEAQIARILELQARNKPSYLRTLLYALRLGATLPATPTISTTSASKPVAAAAAADIDALLDVYLAAPDSLTLTSTVLDLCAQHVSVGEEGSKVAGAVLSVLYASRDGLTDEEVMSNNYSLYCSVVQCGAHTCTR